MKLTSTVLDSPDPGRLARFYSILLDWDIERDDPDWATVRPSDGTAGLSFQLEPLYVAPTWPSTVDKPQMQSHLDIEVDDLAQALESALKAGATLAEYQPQDDVRVCLDPDGHPFCLWVSE